MSKITQNDPPFTVSEYQIEHNKSHLIVLSWLNVTIPRFFGMRLLTFGYFLQSTLYWWIADKVISEIFCDPPFDVKFPFKCFDRCRSEITRLFSLEWAMSNERTFIAIKPDGVQRGLVGKIIKRFEQRGFKLVAMKLCKPGKEHLENHYADLKSKVNYLQAEWKNRNAIRSKIFNS